MKKFILFTIMFLIFSFPIYCFSKTEVTVDLEKLDSNTQNEILKLQKKVSESVGQIDVKVEKIQKYKDIGLAIGVGLKEVCMTLNVEVNNFIKTPAGLIITGLVIYKCGGKDILKLVIMILLCSTFYIFATFSLFWWLGTKKRVKQVVDKVKEYEYIPRLEFKEGSYGKPSGRSICIFIHITSYIITTLILLMTICNL